MFSSNSYVIPIFRLVEIIYFGGGGGGVLLFSSSSFYINIPTPSFSSSQKEKEEYLIELEKPNGTSVQQLKVGSDCCRREPADS